MITINFEDKIYSGNLNCRHTLLEDMWSWCEKQFGPCDVEGGLWYYYGLGLFGFRDQADAVMFVLRWS